MRIQEPLGIIAAGGLLYKTADWKVIKAISQAGTMLFDVSGTRPTRLESETEIEQGYALQELEGILPKAFNSVLAYLEVEDGDEWSPEMLRRLTRGEPVGYDMGKMPGGDSQLVLIILKVITNTSSDRTVLGVMTGHDRAKS